MTIPGRAHTESAKRNATERILGAWRRLPDWRLTQLLYNAVRECHRSAPPPCPQLFFAEDETIADWCEQIAERHDKREQGDV